MFVKNTWHLLSIIFVFVVKYVQLESIDDSRTWDEAIAMAQAFVSQLTLEEKCQMTSGTHGPCVGNVLSIPRLNFTGLCFQDAPSGVGDNVERSTAFPPGIQVAASWDRDLFFKRAVAIGKEFYGKGVHFALGPMINIDRNARHGRNWEGFGSDPYLSGENAFYYVQGLQDQHVVATAKHFICNEQETGRSSIRANLEPYSANVDDKTVHEIYLWPFASSVLAGVGSVMCAYNQVNNTPACQNSHTLNKLLKSELQFKGNVMSDWGATRTGLPSVLGGLDVDMPGGDGLMGLSLLKFVQNGTISESRIDDMIIRILAPHYLLQQDQQYPTIDLNRDTIGENYKISRQISAAGMILLKNKDKILPLSQTSDHSFLVYGQAAGQSRHGFGEGGVLQIGGAIYQGGGSGYVRPTYALDPLTSLFLKSRELHYQIQYITDQLDLNSIEKSRNIGNRANEKCLVFISSFSMEGIDRIDLHASDNGDQLVELVASRCQNTIVIVNSVSQLLLEVWIDHPNVTGVIWSGMPGSEYGQALVDILFGDFNPGGKLVFTLAKRESDYGTHISPTHNSDYREGIFLDYRHFDKNNIVPRFHFGFGLSYTTFSFSRLYISKVKHEKHRMKSYSNFALFDSYKPIYEITFTIQNTGNLNGSEVAQLYLGFPNEAEQPPKILRGFERVYLVPGQSKQISLILTERDISYWNVMYQKWLIAQGTYTVWISTSANNADIKLQDSFHI